MYTCRVFWCAPVWQTANYLFCPNTCENLQILPTASSSFTGCVYLHKCFLEIWCGSVHNDDCLHRCMWNSVFLYIHPLSSTCNILYVCMFVGVYTLTSVCSVLARCSLALSDSFSTSMCCLQSEFWLVSVSSLVCRACISDSFLFSSCFSCSIWQSHTHIHTRIQLLWKPFVIIERTDILADNKKLFLWSKYTCTNTTFTVVEKTQPCACCVVY